MENLAVGSLQFSVALQSLRTAYCKLPTFNKMQKKNITKRLTLWTNSLA
jgi:hypothetical protein